MEGRQISAIDIKRLWHGDYSLVADLSDDMSGSDLAALLPQLTEIKNVHQDTWTIDESEPSQDTYKNQLTGATYRMGSKEMGEVTYVFTIGRYDYETKAALMGGEVITNGEKAVGWKRARGIVELRHVLVALTEDDVYCVLPCANVNTREANTDGAVGLAVVGTMLEPENEALAPEYWFDADEVSE